MPEGEIRRAWSAGEAPAQIAARLNVSGATVYRIAREAGLPPRGNRAARAHKAAGLPPDFSAPALR